VASRAALSLTAAALALGGVTWTGCGGSGGEEAETKPKPTQTSREQAEAQRRVIEGEQQEARAPAEKNGVPGTANQAKQRTKASNSDDATTKADREAAKQRAQYAPSENDTNEQSGAGHGGTGGSGNSSAADRTEQSNGDSASTPGGAEQGNPSKDRSEQAGATEG